MSVEREMWLGQVKAALRPAHLDPVEIREVLMAARAEGFNPIVLYAEALALRPEGLEPAPPLTKVLPPEVMEEEAGIADLEGTGEGAEDWEPPKPDPKT